MGLSKTIITRAEPGTRKRQDNGSEKKSTNRDQKQIKHNFNFKVLAKT